MNRRVLKYAFFLSGFFWVRDLRAQNTPPSPNHASHSREEKSLDQQLFADLQPKWDIDGNKLYTLPELIDLAELHNPITRNVWERARIRAAELNVARSAYYPTLTAAVLGASTRHAALIGEFFHRQTIAVLEPTLQVEYLIFDLGGRSGQVDVAKANLLIANLEFNDTHRQLIFRITATYFRLLNAKGQKESAEVSLKNAEAIEADADNRLKNGLATKPDLLEATAARAQADYDFQATLGAEKIAQAELATLMGLPAETEFRVQSISELPIPQSIADSLEDEIERALRQRPELLAEIARIRSAKGLLKQARSTYFPTVRFVGDGGLVRGYGHLNAEEPLLNLARRVAQLTNELEADVFKEPVFASHLSRLRECSRFMEYRFAPLPTKFPSMACLCGPCATYFDERIHSLLCSGLQRSSSPD
jgi:outer membrane protein